MAVFTQGGEWLLKNGTIFFGETYISLDISMSRCTFSLCASIKGQIFVWDFPLVNLAQKNAFEFVGQDHQVF